MYKLLEIYDKYILKVFYLKNNNFIIVVEILEENFIFHIYKNLKFYKTLSTSSKSIFKKIYIDIEINEDKNKNIYIITRHKNLRSILTCDIYNDFTNLKILNVKNLFPFNRYPSTNFYLFENEERCRHFSIEPKNTCLYVDITVFQNGETETINKTYELEKHLEIDYTLLGKKYEIMNLVNSNKVLINIINNNKYIIYDLDTEKIVFKELNCDVGCKKIIDNMYFLIILKDPNFDMLYYFYQNEYVKIKKRNHVGNLCLNGNSLNNSPFKNSSILLYKDYTFTTPSNLKHKHGFIRHKTLNFIMIIKYFYKNINNNKLKKIIKYF